MFDDARSKCLARQGARNAAPYSFSDRQTENSPSPMAESVDGKEQSKLDSERLLTIAMRIPIKLTEYKQWVLWRKTETSSRTTKIPISPWTGKTAACDRPSTWSSYRHARYARQKYQCDGLGFVFTCKDPYCGIDLDRCRTDDGVIAPWAMDLIERFNSYAEWSPSGNGLHILIEASLSGKGRRREGIEVYDRGRYFTITGDHLPMTPFAIGNCQNILEELMPKVFSDKPPTAGMQNVMYTQLHTDDELIERAANARNGERFKRLWAGETSSYGNDHSRADMALCRMLKFWCGNDLEQLDRLFRRSGLMREKWDRRTGNCSYGARTIKTMFE